MFIVQCVCSSHCHCFELGFKDLEALSFLWSAIMCVQIMSQVKLSLSCMFSCCVFELCVYSSSPLHWLKFKDFEDMSFLFVHCCVG
jgi:hypothetical protein